tara:strand:+ start:123 stop:461 length:339 start_codon:yes stop_codon:yes gene_type:complete
MDYQRLADEYFSPDQLMSLKYKMTLVFRDFLKYKIWKYEKHKDLDYSCMALSERVCLNLAFLVAIKQFEIDIQIDVNINPLDFIDSELRKGVSESQDYTKLMSVAVGVVHQN